MLAIVSLLASAGLPAESQGAASSREKVQHSRTRCKKIGGKFQATVLPPEACDSPVGFCTRGSLSGSLQGTYDLRVEQFSSPQDARIAAVSFFTGTSSVSSSLGDFIAVDTGSINLGESDDPGAGRFSTLLTVLSPEAPSPGAIESGYLHVTGGSGAEPGTVKGRYSGRICFYDDSAQVSP